MERGKPGFEEARKLSKLERLVFEYFVKHISVGEIAAVMELKDEVKRLKDPELVPELDDVVIEFEINKALARLVERGFLEHTTGCYNLAEHLRRRIIERRGSLDPGFSKNFEGL